MSLLNAWVTPTEALVAVDTDGVRGDGSRFATSKLLPIPHLNAVVALRGQAAFLQFLYLRCIGAGFDTFDEFTELLPAVLEEVTESMPPELIAMAEHVSTGNVLLAVGWSDRRGAMLGRQHVQRAAGEAFAVADFTTLLAPWPSALQDMPRTAAAVAQLSRAQVEWMRSTYPGAIVGGQLLRCRLGKWGISMNVMNSSVWAELAA